MEEYTNEKYARNDHEEMLNEIVYGIVFFFFSFLSFIYSLFLFQSIEFLRQRGKILEEYSKKCFKDEVLKEVKKIIDNMFDC